MSTYFENVGAIYDFNVADSVWLQLILSTPNRFKTALK
mgnify:CR=1 FL=1